MLTSCYIWMGSRTEEKVLARAQLPTCDSNAVQQHFRKPDVGMNWMRRRQHSMDRQLQEPRGGRWTAWRGKTMGESTEDLWRTAAQLSWLTHGEVPANPFSMACVVPGDPEIPLHEDICTRNSLAAAVHTLPLTEASLRGQGEESDWVTTSSVH